MNCISIKAYRNKFVFFFHKTGNTVTVVPEQPISSKRLLISEFGQAIELFKITISTNHKGIIKPVVIFQPMDFLEEGLSDVENRIYQEVCYKAGARNVFIALNDNELQKLLQNKEIFKLHI